VPGDECGCRGSEKLGGGGADIQAFLAFWVPVPVWAAGLGLIGMGLLWKSFETTLWA
jgi:hypothetical protein